MDSSPGPSARRLACRALPTERLILTGVHLFDPNGGLDEEGDVLIEEGKIAALGAGVKKPTGVKTVDIYKGCWVFPGFVDPHCHLRTPGFEYKEDLESGSLAAAAGGYVTIVAMANTSPVVDCGPLATWILDEAAEKAIVRVGQVGSVSKGLEGQELSEMHELAHAGVSAFSDDGRPVADADLLLHALRYARGTELPLMLHVEDPSLSADGVMHEGEWSARLGLRGIPAAAETCMLARDLELIRYADAENERIVASRATKGKVETSRVRRMPLAHLQHVSSGESLRLLRQARQDGLPVSSEVTPEHLLLTDERLSTLDQNLKINPPIRAEEDRRQFILISSLFADGSGRYMQRLNEEVGEIVEAQHGEHGFDEGGFNKLKTIMGKG